MRCVVLGATGFIGTNLCQELIAQGFSVRAFGRSLTFPGSLQGCEWFSGDFTSSSSLASAVTGCDVVFHLVNATTPVSANLDKIDDVKSNVISSLHLLDICRLSGVKRVVFVSSGGTVYGIPDVIPTPESASTNPITSYGISKLAIEKYLSLYEYLYGLEYRVLRVANPFGPYQLGLKHQGVIAAFLKQVLTGQAIEIWGDGNVARDYIYVGDVAKALVLAATHEGGSRVFNIGSGEGRSLNDLVGAIGSMLGISIDVIYRSGRLVDVPISILDTALAWKELGWRSSTSFMMGLQETGAWIDANIKMLNQYKVK